MLEVAEPITICDEFIFFILVQLETITLRKSSNVTFDSLIESYGLNLIELCKVGIHYNLLTSDGEDTALDEIRSINLKLICGLYVVLIVYHICDDHRDY